MGAPERLLMYLTIGYHKPSLAERAKHSIWDRLVQYCNIQCHQWYSQTQGLRIVLKNKEPLKKKKKKECPRKRKMCPETEQKCAADGV